jgi:hypothetical protein
MRHQNLFIFTFIVLGSLWLLWRNFFREGLTAAEEAAETEAAKNAAKADSLKTGFLSLMSANDIDVGNIDTASMFDQLKTLTSLSMFSGAGTAAGTAAGPAAGTAAGTAAGSDEDTTPLDTTPYKEYPEQTFFYGKKFSDAFGLDPSNNDCSVLNVDSCNDTKTCIWLKSNKCAPGNASGPTFAVDLDATLDYDYYSFKNKCYGNCNMLKN